MEAPQGAGVGADLCVRPSVILGFSFLPSSSGLLATAKAMRRQDPEIQIIFALKFSHSPLAPRRSPVSQPGPRLEDGQGDGEEKAKTKGWIPERDALPMFFLPARLLAVPHACLRFEVTIQ
jgi:hypothetical protein